MFRGQDTVVADFKEPFGQYVQQEAPNSPREITIYLVERIS